MVNLWSRTVGSGNSNLDTDLKRVTESGVIEIPQDLFSAVSRSSHNEQDRREIMKHLRCCLAEPSNKRWRRIYAALLLVEDLVKNGSQDLLLETAEGHHFDLVQRLSLLEHFECTSDRRVQGMVRTKACALRADVVPRLQTAQDSCTGDAGASSAGIAPSSCNNASTSASTTSTASSEEPAAPWKPQGQMILNGIAVVGHTDDTTSESSGDEIPKAVQYRQARKEPRKAAAKGRRQQRGGSHEDSSESEDRRGKTGSLGGSNYKGPPPEAAPAPTVDLLDL